MSKNYLIDYNFGIESENNIIHALQTHFNDDSIIKLNKCHTFDFKGNNKYIELKTRRNNYLKYPTTLIGLNKFKEASTLDEDVYFCFKFTDGLYLYKYDRDYKLNIKFNHCSRQDRGHKEINDYVFLPIEMLIKID
jgi:hypothetical protein